MEIITFQIPSHEGITLITDDIIEYISRNRIKDGFVFLQTPEQSVAMTFADTNNPNIEQEYLKKMNHLLPKYDGLQYTGPATPGIKAAFIGQTMQIMVESGTLLLGLHQGVYAADFDGRSTSRNIFISHMGTTLSKDEEPTIPKILADLHQSTAEAEKADQEAEARAIAEMRAEYAEQHKDDPAHQQYLYEKNQKEKK